jgi:two-component system NtrC family sensor kinase
MVKLPGKLANPGSVAGMSEQDFSKTYERMQSYVGWTEEDAHRVAALWPLIAPAAETLIDDFYAEIKRHVEAARVITGGTAQIDRLSATLREWLAQLFAGVYDTDYIARRWRVGHRHVEIGLAQRFTSLALSRLRGGNDEPHRRRLDWPQGTALPVARLAQ